jgi:hypothetical protein
MSPAPAFDYLDMAHNHERPLVEANGRLIIAAPDMYEALEAIAEHGSSQMASIAEAALAKARGEA